VEAVTSNSAINVIWEPQPGPQTDLITCPCFEVFFGGARGGGKTDGMLGEWASHADLYGKNASGLMVRRTRTELIDTIERSKQLFLPLGWKFNEQDKMWRSPDDARLRFAYLERDTDAEAYQGHNYTRVYVEEIGNFPSPKPIMKLMATLRSGAGVPVGFRATGNPGGPGHMWVRERYIDPDPRGYRIVSTSFVNPWTSKTVERDRVFIPSKVTDNRFLGAEYIAQLQMAGSAELVRAWLEGDWSAIEGAFFDKWSPRNVVEAFDVPADWLRFRSMDWGYASPFSVGWWAVAGDDYRLTGRTGFRTGTAPGQQASVHSGSEGAFSIPRGSLIRYREWYGCNGTPNEGLRLTAEEVATGIATREAGERLKYGVLDPAAFNQDGGPSIGERINKVLHGTGLVGFHRADNTRVGARGAMSGWDQMRARISGDERGPRLFVFDTCKDFLRTVPVLQHDPDRPEDLDTETEDHVADEARYGCSSRPWVPSPAPAKKPTGMQYQINEQGRVVSNMSIMDYVKAKERKRKRDNL